MSIKFGGTIQCRRGTAAEWTSQNPVLAAGEIGFETDTKKLKIGDGSTAWADLDDFAGSGSGSSASSAPAVAMISSGTSKDSYNPLFPAQDTIELNTAGVTFVSGAPYVYLPSGHTLARVNFRGAFVSSESSAPSFLQFGIVSASSGIVAADGAALSSDGSRYACSCSLNFPAAASIAGQLQVGGFESILRYSGDSQYFMLGTFNSVVPGSVAPSLTGYRLQIEILD